MIALEHLVTKHQARPKGLENKLKTEFNRRQQKAKTKDSHCCQQRHIKITRLSPESSKSSSELSLVENVKQAFVPGGKCIATVPGGKCKAGLFQSKV